jgi:hypothetical protein
MYQFSSSICCPGKRKEISRRQPRGLHGNVGSPASIGYADLPLRLLCCGMDGAAWKAAMLSSVVASAAAASLTWLGLLLCGRGVGWFSSAGAAGPAPTREAVSSSAYIISVHGRDPLCFSFRAKRAAAGRGVGDARRRRDATTRAGGRRGSNSDRCFNKVKLEAMSSLELDSLTALAGITSSSILCNLCNPSTNSYGPPQTNMMG